MDTTTEKLEDLLGHTKEVIDGHKQYDIESYGTNPFMAKIVAKLFAHEDKKYRLENS